jgi:hypothetical protein
MDISASGDWGHGGYTAAGGRASIERESAINTTTAAAVRFKAGRCEIQRTSVVIRARTLPLVNVRRQHPTLGGLKFEGYTHIASSDAHA